MESEGYELGWEGTRLTMSPVGEAFLALLGLADCAIDKKMD